MSHVAQAAQPGEDRLAFATRVIHGGQSPDPVTGAVMPAISVSSTYRQQSPGVHSGYEYGRTHNPTRQAYERAVADLESGAQAYAFASGLAAMATVLDTLPAGSHIVAGDDLYGGSYRLFERVRKLSAGLQVSYVDTRNPDAVQAALRPDTRLIWIETPSNPLLKLTDLAAVAAIARRHGALAVADNTFASPWAQRPLELGFDLVLHSATKYLNGHCDVIGGAVVVGGEARQAAAREQLGFLHNAVGAIAGPFDSFLALRGLKTLALRMERHNASAQELAQWLSEQPQVGQVHYPGLPTHPQYALAQRQARGGRRHDQHRAGHRPRRRPPLPGARAALCPGREPGRGGEPHLAAGPHDACLHPARDSRAPRHHGFAGAAVRGRGGRGRPAPRPGAGAGGSLTLPAQAEAGR